MKNEYKPDTTASESCGCGSAPAAKSKNAKVKAASAKKGSRCAPRKRCGS